MSSIGDVLARQRAERSERARAQRAALGTVTVKRGRLSAEALATWPRCPECDHLMQRVGSEYRCHWPHWDDGDEDSA